MAPAEFTSSLNTFALICFNALIIDHLQKYVKIMKVCINKR